ncbi:GntR family transcriptional regulator [Mycolicibacterium doricum]|uniref:GntR family transcriptional regulator n=1 Tax=Mycolicibacterium doricum TaxID=126673 RepID=UPI000D6AD147|nr:GntR family transcriptional regulator [Mycolicibacterium doricum]MCV7267373.1 GntR family transcriptional regulator [Mycolicibacterium doricum]
MNAPVRRRPARRRASRREQLSDEVAGHLRAAIMTGSLRPGTFMRLDETAAELGVSDEGMVQLEPHRGHVGVPMTRGDIEEVAFAEFGGSLLHVARYLPLLLYTTDQNCGVEAVASHRELIAALRRRDAETVVRLTTGPFTDGAQRLILRPEQIGLWG